MSNYAQAKLAIDVAKENRWKKKQAAKAERARQKEEESKGIFGFIGKAIGALVAGPVGYVVGGYIGREGADLLIDSESEFVDEGKFNRSSVETYNKDLKTYDASVDLADVFNTAKDSLFAFNAAGGITKDGLDFDVDMTKWMTAEGPKSSGEIVKNVLTKDKNLALGNRVSPEEANTPINMTLEDSITKSTETSDITDTLSEAIVPQKTITATPGVYDYSSYGSFDKAFSLARQNNESTFMWQGELYSVQLDNTTLAGVVGDDPTALQMRTR